ncbi:MAG: NAD-dependent epimerase/dehydratase family protein [Nitrospirae bacterium]|nr:NAD-dependent epimerase/dehydratase family protein [Nitrospirota bacterium]
MRVLLTGGAGFIGSYLARRLLLDGHAVTIVDNLSTGKRKNVPDGADFIELDLAQSDCLKFLPSVPFDAVCHLAAQSSGPVSAEIPYYDLQANAASTLLLSRWCLQNHVPRFLYASSMAIYGNVESFPVCEDIICLPRSYYGVSKLTSEHFLRLASQEGLSVTSLRMFSVYGPGQNLGNLNQGMVSIYLAYLLRGEPVPVTGSLDRFRDFVYIDDVLDAWLGVLQMPSTPSLVYNIGTGKPTKVHELLAAQIAALHLPSDYPIYELPGSSFDQFGLYADVQRSKAELNWQPVISLEKGLEKMVAWATSQKKV